MQYTTNYNLRKPDGSDYYNVEDFNFNADEIDAELKKIKDDGDDALQQEIEDRTDADESLDERVKVFEGLMTPAAAFHNCIYRGKYLGTQFTAEQSAAVRAGTFDDLWIGDYWTINGVNWRIAHFDYWYNCGDTACTTHHAVIVPDTNLYTAQMHNTSSGAYKPGTTANTTDGGYVGSDMYTTNLATAKNAAIAAFGSGHILSHREYLTNAVTNGRISAGAWYDSTLELMTERQVYGNSVFAPSHDGSNNDIRGSYHAYTVDFAQFALFRLDKSAINKNRIWYWLRDVVNAVAFASVDGGGNADCDDASSVNGVRPAFPIY